MNSLTNMDAAEKIVEAIDYNERYAYRSIRGSVKKKLSEMFEEHVNAGINLTH